MWFLGAACRSHFIATERAMKGYSMLSLVFVLSKKGLEFVFGQSYLCLYKNCFSADGNLAYFPQDLNHFSAVLIIPQMYDPYKSDIVRKGNEQAH